MAKIGEETEQPLVAPAPWRYPEPIEEPSPPVRIPEKTPA